MKTNCACIDPDQGNDKWVAVGRQGNIVDYEVCGTCNLPIMGTQTTHEEITED